MARYSALVNKFTLLTENFSSKVIEQLVDYVEEEYYMPNQIIFQQNQEMEEPKLYLVIKGQVNL